MGAWKLRSTDYNNLNTRTPEHNVITIEQLNNRYR
jgi:hypothetical protein